jgi:hypothetical protein
LQKASEVETKEVILLLPSACLLVPTTVKPADYARLMSNPPVPFTDEKGRITVPSDSSADDVIKSITSVFRSFVVQQSAKAALLFSRSFQVRCTAVRAAPRPLLVVLLLLLFFAAAGPSLMSWPALLFLCDHTCADAAYVLTRCRTNR